MRKTKEPKIKDHAVSNAHLDFLCKGLACHALCLIEYVGILRVIRDNGEIHKEDLCALKNPNLIHAALVTLVGAHVLTLNKNTYRLTELGKNLEKHIGAIFLPLVGYRHLFAKQFELASNPSDWKDSDIDFSAIALASIDFGLRDLDPIILEIFQQIKPKGTICDLGCGTAEKLVKICKTLNIDGLGIEKDPKVIEGSQKYTKDYPRVEVIKEDIMNLKGIWEDVDIAMISMVYHDITPSQLCVDFLKSLCIHFPRLQCLVVADIVSPSEKLPTIMPGFDYVHGLQGITPRNYEETLQTFTDANFSILKEIAVPNIPNMFIWVIVPRNYKTNKTSDSLAQEPTLD